VPLVALCKCFACTFFQTRVSQLDHPQSAGCKDIVFIDKFYFIVESESNLVNWEKPKQLFSSIVYRLKMNLTTKLCNWFRKSESFLRVTSSLHVVNFELKLFLVFFC